MIYIVIALGHSGTTLVAQTLHHSGINMLDDSDRQDDDGRNLYEILSTKKLGALEYQDRSEITALLYERVSTNYLNIAILMNDMPASMPRNKLVGIYLPNGPISPTEEQRIKMRAIIEENNRKYADWGFKDPRTCLTYPIWEQELPPHRLIFVFRSYAEIIRSYHLSGWRQILLQRMWKVLKAWVFFNRRIVEYIQTTKQPYLLLSYEALMTDPKELERLSNFAGRPLFDKRNQKQHRSKSNDPYSLPLTAKLLTPFLRVKPADLLNELHHLREASLSFK